MKKLWNALVIMVLSLSLSLSSFAADESEVAGVNSFISKSPAETIDLYKTNESVDYQVSQQKVLYDFNGEPSYTMYSLLPYGYAILLNSTNGLLEACYSEYAVNPIDMSSSVVYYYGGPGLYCIQENDVFINTFDGVQLSAEMVANAITAQEEVCAYEMQKASILTGKETEMQRTATYSTSSGMQTYQVEYNYFSSLTDYGRNVNGTCTVIAIQMLLGYYDYFINELFVPTSYESGLGTTEAFHQLLNDYVYGEEDQGGIYIRNTTAAINQYLADQNVQCELQAEYSSQTAAINRIITMLQDNIPVIASMSTLRGAPYNHSVLVYGVTYDSTDPVGTAVLTMNMGWRSGTAGGQSNTEYVASAGWFYECGYINSVCECHLFSMWREVCAVYHKRNCLHCDYVEIGKHADHWNLSTQKCTLCGRSGTYGDVINAKSPLPIISCFDYYDCVGV